MMFNYKGYASKLCLLLIASSFAGLAVSAQQPFQTDKALTAKIQKTIAGFQGDIGVYVYNLKSGMGAAINADTIFPTASTIKVPILCALMDKIVRNELSFQQSMVYHSAMAAGGSGFMEEFKDNSKVDLSLIMAMMITVSDNTAALWCQYLAGGGARINEWLDEHGFKSTRVNSRTKGRSANYSEYGWGQTTPREIATLLVDICKNRILTPAACDRMYRNLTNIYWDERALSQIPPYIQTASKTGSVKSARCEVVLVSAPHGDYVFAVYTKNIKDKSWGAGNEAATLVRKISALLWQYFEPESKWHPAPNYEKFRV